MSVLPDEAGIEFPRSLAEALQLLAEPGPPATVLAGGIGVMAALAAGRSQPEWVMDISALDELRGIRIEDDHLWIGALTTYAELLASPELPAVCPLLVAAARASGSVQLRNRATLGGAIASALATTELLPALVAWEAGLEIASAAGRRWVSVVDFLVGDGMSRRQPTELVAGVRLPRHRNDGELVFRKVAGRRALAVSKVILAGRARVTNEGLVEEVAIALGAVTPSAMRARRTESTLTGNILTPARIEEARHTVIEEISPVDDLYSTAQYRRSVTGRLVAGWLGDLAVARGVAGQHAPNSYSWSRTRRDTGRDRPGR